MPRTIATTITAPSWLFETAVEVEDDNVTRSEHALRAKLHQSVRDPEGSGSANEHLYSYSRQRPGGWTRFNVDNISPR
jgi:hypothetical protein